MPTPMRVKAIARGFYGHLVEPGTVFVIADESLLGAWMVPMDQADIDRLAERLADMKANRRFSVPVSYDPTIPVTGAQLRDPPVPKVLPPRSAPKAEKPSKDR